MASFSPRARNVSNSGGMSAQDRQRRASAKASQRSGKSRSITAMLAQGEKTSPTRSRQNSSSASSVERSRWWRALKAAWKRRSISASSVGNPCVRPISA
jgi:hypothetical protein